MRRIGNSHLTDVTVFASDEKNLDSGDGSSRNLRLWQACTPAFLKHIGGQTQVDMLHEQIEAMQEAPLVT